MSICPPRDYPPSSLKNEAFELMILLRESRSPELDQRAREWINASPEHTAEWQRCTRVWDLVWSLAASETLAAAIKSGALPKPRRT